MEKSTLTYFTVITVTLIALVESSSTVDVTTPSPTMASAAPPLTPSKTASAGITSQKFTSAGLINTVADTVYYGGWRSWKQLAQYSEDDKRNTLIVEMNKHSSLTIPQLQGKASYGRIDSLVGMAAICIFLRDTQIRSINQLKQMSDHDQRNALIVELYHRIFYPVSFLQPKGDLDLVRIGSSRL